MEKRDFTCKYNSNTRKEIVYYTNKYNRELTEMINNPKRKVKRIDMLIGDYQDKIDWKLAGYVNCKIYINFDDNHHVKSILVLDYDGKEIDQIYFN